ncbi:pentapeptide repeat-containing protein [Scytonema hofmannii]|nr:pentapeptide repeat-containing protein [Scytonema hofmannii]
MNSNIKLTSETKVSCPDEGLHLEINGEDFSGQNLTNRRFNGTRFNGCNFSYCILNGAKCQEAQFTGVNLSNAKFIGTNLSKAKFREVNLNSVDFTGAEVNNAEFAKCKGLHYEVKRDLESRGAKFFEDVDSPTGKVQILEKIIIPLLIGLIGSGGIIGLFSSKEQPSPIIVPSTSKSPPPRNN